MLIRELDTIILSVPILACASLGVVGCVLEEMDYPVAREVVGWVLVVRLS